MKLEILARSSADRFRVLFRRRRFRRAAMTLWLALPGAAIVLALVINLRKPWEFDESYNLQVVDNLRRGFGYSSNGAFRGIGPYEFDPYVSTGPAVLLPIWLLSELIRSTLVAARAVMFLYLMLLVLGIRKLLPDGQRGWFKFGLALMALTSVVGATNPLFVLGEIPALSLAVMSIVAISRNKELFAGLCAGAVILCKLNFLFASISVILISVVVITFETRTTWRGVIRRILRLFAGAAVLPFLFELYRLVSLGGPTAYRTNISELRQFIDTQRLDHWTHATELLGRKLNLLLAIPGLGLSVALGLSILFLLVTPNPPSQRLAPEESTTVRLEAVILPALFVVGTFLFVSNVWFVRQGASSLYLLVPVPVVVAVNRAFDYRRCASWAMKYVGAGFISVVSAILLVNVVGEIDSSVDVIASESFSSAYHEQLRVAEVIRDSGATSIVLDGWFQNPDLQLLSRVPAASMPDVDLRPIIVISSIKYYFGGSGGSLQAEEERCREVLYRTEQILVCWPKIP